jgi:uncharacterized protein YggT (Ycf19 family)
MTMTDYERRTEVETSSDPHVTRDAATRRVSERYIETGGPGPVSVAARIVTFVFGILQVLLVLRIILLLLVANQGNDVVSFVLGVTDPFVEPFRGMFQLDRVTADQGSTLDVAAIVALIGWTLIEALVLAGIRIFSRRPAAV